ncbi:MAG: hypothetical protein DMG14_09190 [Acidobacteria bacterium]|nr:MAG: hypothetical protein DMG14_09190 [Acidobacteriota bacterium]
MSTSPDAKSIREPHSFDPHVRLVIDTIPGFVWCAGPDGRIEFLNQRGLDYTGFSLDQIKGWNWKDTNILHPDDMQSLLESWGAIVASGDEGEIQARMRRFDGQYRWFLFRVAPLRDDSGRLVAWWGIDVEIDERKNAEDLLEGENKLLEMIATGAPLSLVLDSMCRLIEATNSGTHCSVLLVDSSRNALKHGAAPTLPARLVTALNGAPLNPRAGPCALATYRKESVIVSDVSSDERWDSGEWQNVVIESNLRSCWTSPIFSSDKEVLGTFAIYSSEPCHPTPRYQKIIDQFTHVAAVAIETSRAEEKIRQDERELREIVEAIPQFITVLAPNGNTLYVNRPVLEFTGLSLDELRAGALRTRVIHQDDRGVVGDEIRRALSAGKPFESEYRLLGKDGKYRWFFNRFNPLLNEDGQIIRWYVTGVEIDDRKQAEQRVRNEIVALREDIDRVSMFEEIVGSSDALNAVLAQVARVAPMDSTVLILGETGTGKELVARAIHKRSNRSARPFIRVNCAAIPSSLIASELFGHEKGAFTGALARRLGRFESADGGTIFLDEIGELPIETQVALLRVLQEREFERVGSSQPISVDVRVVAATNRDLKLAVEASSFRADLFYRFNVFPLRVPSLRERVDDIPLLVEYLIERYAKKAGKRIRNINARTMELFKTYTWPGNVRELQNVIERAVILCDGETFSVDETWLQHEASRESRVKVPLRHLGRLDPVQEMEMIEAALEESRGRVAGPLGAAAKLRIPRQTLESRITSLGINKHRFKSV